MIDFTGKRGLGFRRVRRLRQEMKWWTEVKLRMLRAI
jgi:hypothetical protein